jgi:hypothetical protein
VATGFVQRGSSAGTLASAKQAANKRRKRLRGIFPRFRAGCALLSSTQVALETLRVCNDDSEELCRDQADKCKQPKNIIHGVRSGGFGRPPTRRRAPKPASNFAVFRRKFSVTCSAEPEVAHEQLTSHIRRRCPCRCNRSSARLRSGSAPRTPRCRRRSHMSSDRYQTARWQSAARARRR